MIFRATALSWVVAALCFTPTAFSVTNYADDFVDPAYILDFQYQTVTAKAQQIIVQWANALNLASPWSVTSKKYLAPSGDKHDYMSWRPYYWPNCTNAGNTTVLTVDEMFKTCDYYNVDGALNPDARLINNVGDFDDLANAVLYNALAWGITRSGIYSKRVVSYLNTWFLDADTYMNPNLNYAQMAGGPTGQNGTHTGVLDLKCMAKICAGVELLRQGNAEGWNSTFDASLQGWVTQYISWITTDSIAVEEKKSTNNHGTFYFAQLASLYILANDTSNAASTAQEYFTTTFTAQINADGDQPLESARTRPYHYLAYNLAAMITVGRLGQYAGYDGWNSTSTLGGTIPAAADFAMAYPPGADTASELYPFIGAVGAIYGDSDSTLASWLNTQTNGSYISDASYLWNQPLSDSGVSANMSYITFAANPKGTGTLSVGTQPTGGTSSSGGSSSSATPRSSAVSWSTIGAMVVLAVLCHL